jgi:crotonobetaine/carnitine-CoA ligase
MTRQRTDQILADQISLRAERNPDFPVLTFECAGKPDGVRTFAQLHEHANRLAATLIARGLGRGDRFALMMRNHPEFAEAMIAASISATVFVPIDPRTRGDKLAYTLRNSGARAIVLADYNLEQLAAVRAQLPALELVLALDTGGEDGAAPLDAFPGVESLNAILDRPVPTVDVRVESPADKLQVIYTSGTTGDPKGVVMDNARMGGSGMLGILFGFTREDRLYTGLSLTHGNAQAVTFASAIFHEIPAVISRRFTKSRLWDICRKHGCTTFSLLGGMATAIYSEPTKPNDRDNPVRFVTSAGMPRAIWESFEQRFDVRILEWYGAVEGGLALKPIGVGPVGSFGKPPATLEMKILDDDDRECPPGVLGEICTRPRPTISATGQPVAAEAPRVEYLGNPDASAKKTARGWLRSGDVGHTDQDGWFFFDYRKGGGIRHNGDFVNTGFVEKVVAEHPAVADVFVYGVPAASGAPGEKDVVAAVVPLEGARLDPASLFAHCRAGLESNFVPSYLQVVAEIPKTASEKPQERFLLDAFSPAAANVFTPA